MADNEPVNDSRDDAFSPIANHYDAIMEHVDYARWQYITQALAEMLSKRGMHLDAGCGTGVLLERLADADWNSVGVDISPTMLRVARHRRNFNALARADLCALPFSEQFQIITCLFDSINFLLQEEQVRRAFGSFQQALAPGGLLYFDVVTKQMITDHFDNESWMENHGRFRSSWHSTYDRATRLCETRVRINSGQESVTRERIYTTEFITEALTQAGLNVLAMRDAYTWKKPGRRTTRIDFIVGKGDSRDLARRFQRIDRTIKTFVSG